MTEGPDEQPVTDDTVTENQQDGARFSRKQKILALIAGVIVLCLAYFMLAGGEEERPFASDDGQAPTVTVITPGTASIDDEITATGTLAARREMPVGVVGEGGRVVSVQVEPGDWVSAGQTLAVIDRNVQNQQAQSAAAQIDVAKADAELAQSNLDRALKLVERGFISQADIDRLTATRDSAIAQVKVAQAQYRELLARNARLNITAPAAGLVLTRDVEPGQVVGSGSGVLFSIARGGQMELLAQLGETALASVKAGVTAQVTPVGTDKTFEGQVWQVSPIIDEANRQGIARIALDYAPELRPGGFATARIAAGSVVAPMLPESAILSDDKGSYVYVIGKDNKTVRRSVTTGIVTDKGIAVTSGIKGSEKIVLRAGAFLTEGETVQPVAPGKE
ncbi:efflux RND transporter periplasmic adaptor subunit [Altericroceibacterium spongiae]|nr:efflux RND transporter periplasmic adaptor subunit [Altericroceibacterium spongiae]